MFGSRREQTMIKKERREEWIEREREEWIERERGM